MPLTPQNHFQCDLKKPDGSPDCDVAFSYDPGRQGVPPPVWEPSIQVALSKIIATTHSLTGFVTMWCCDEHAAEGIKRGQHMPPAPSKLTASASDADLKRVAAQAAQTSGMKVVK